MAWRTWCLDVSVSDMMTHTDTDTKDVLRRKIKVWMKISIIIFIITVLIIYSSRVTGWNNKFPIDAFKKRNWRYNKVSNHLHCCCFAVIVRGRHLMLRFTLAIVLTVEDTDACQLKCIVCCPGPSSLIIKCQTSFCVLFFLVGRQQGCSCFTALPPFQLFPP